LQISFLIPSYNHHSYIIYTLNSIYSDAEGLDYEIIIIDDGSTDDSKTEIVSWCRLHALVNIKVIFRENRGLCVTLNELVNLAVGDIIRLCASDDGVFLGSSRRIIETFENSEYLALVGDAYVIDDSNNVIGSSAIDFNGGNRLKMQTQLGLKEEIISNWSMPGPCFALRRRIYEIVGSYSEDLLIEDWDFFLRVAALCSVKYVDEYFAYYRLHSANACKTTDVKRRCRNMVSQLTAGSRRLHMFRGRLRILLKIECYILRLKILYLRLTLLLAI
jgi:alpha-1,3-rhamnosyltransferase